MKMSQKGFTLIELMITVAIVAILTAVALPAYQDYTARAQLSEGLSLVSGAKPLVAEYHANHGSFPASLTNTGYTGAVGKYIASTTIGTNGEIIATLGGQASSKITGTTVTLTPTVQNEGNLSWNCTSSAEVKYLPSSCAHADASNGNAGNGNNGNGSTPGTGHTVPEQVNYSGTLPNGTTVQMYDGYGDPNHGTAWLSLSTTPNGTDRSVWLSKIATDANGVQTFRGDAGGFSVNMSYNPITKAFTYTSLTDENGGPVDTSQIWNQAAYTDLQTLLQSNGKNLTVWPDGSADYE